MFVASLLPDQLIVVRDSVGFAVLATVDVDTEDAPEEVLRDVLSVPTSVHPVPILDVALTGVAEAIKDRIRGTSSVSERDLRVPGEAERDRLQARMTLVRFLFSLAKTAIGEEQHRRFTSRHQSVDR